VIGVGGFLDDFHVVFTQYADATDVVARRNGKV
jgi:hypothetical protein